MEVIVSRSGGLAGLSMTWRVAVDERADAREWYGLVRRVPWEAPPPASPAPDRYSYRIRAASHEVTIPERQLTGPWRELVDRVRQVAEPLSTPPAPARPR